MTVIPCVQAPVVAERQEAAVVGVADLRREPVGPRVVASEGEHRVQALAVPVGQAAWVERVGGLRPAHEQLGHEPVVRDRGLVRAAVAAHLMLHLGDELPDCPAAPGLALPPVGEQSGDGKQPDDVGEVVVAASTAVLEVRADEPAVEEEALESRPEPGLVGAVLCAESQRCDPVRRADRDVHRAGPVGPELDRVRADPGRELGAELVEVAALAGLTPGGCEQRQVLAARELPRHLDVRAVAVGDGQERRVAERPAAAGLEVRVPVDLGAEVGRPGAEQVEAVRADRVGPAAQVVDPTQLLLEARDSRQRLEHVPA